MGCTPASSLRLPGSVHIVGAVRGQSVPYRAAEKSAAAGNQDPTVGQRFDGILLIALGHRFNVSAFRVAGCSQEVPPVKVAFPLLQCWNKVPGGTATAAVSLVRAVGQRGNVELVGIRPHGADCPPELADVDMSWAALPARFSVPLPLLYEAWTYTPLSGIESAVRAATGSVPDLVHTSMPIIPRAGSIVTHATWPPARCSTETNG